MNEKDKEMLRRLQYTAQDLTRKQGLTTLAFAAHKLELSGETRLEPLLSSIKKALEAFGEMSDHLLEFIEYGWWPNTEEGQNETNIYLMRDGHTGLTKIGRSKSPRCREKTLGATTPLIRLLWSHVGYAKDEKTLHQMFASKRVRGEWFNLSDKDVESIKSYQFGEEES
jgi:hypothetical protein